MEVPEIDPSRLEDFTNGDRAEMREFIDLYFDQTQQQLTDLESALREGSWDKIKQVAHTAAGASGTCGINSLLATFREIEAAGFNHSLGEVPALLQKATAEFNRVRTYFDQYLRQ